MQEIPKYFSSEFTDRFINFVRGTGEMMIQMEMEFNSRLDIDRLTKALDITLDAEPVLGCRFVKRWWRPRWERLDAGGREVLTIAGDARAYDGFKHASIDPYIGPQIKACLFHDTGRDRLLIKVAHEVSDARGVTQIARVISSTYSRLAHEPEYRPEPNIDGDRSTWQVMRHVPWHAYPVIVYNYYRLYMIPFLFPIVSVRLPIVDDKDRTLGFVNRRVPEGSLQHIIEYGRQHDGTLNDVVTASFFHAITTASEWDRKSQLRILMTVDLRRFNPDKSGGGICNLSGMEVVNLRTDLTDDFGHTVKRISSFMNRRKAKWIGINDYVALAPSSVFFSHDAMKGILLFAVRSLMKIKQAPYVLTNMGAIAQKDVTFDVPPVEARFLPPVNYPPHMIICFYSYNGSLTISAGSWPCSKVHVERCLDEMVVVLKGLTVEKAQVAF